MSRTPTPLYYSTCDCQQLKTRTFYLLSILDEVDGHKQIALDGKSLVYSFNAAAASSQCTEQLYEMFGNRAM